ncbi:MAG: hypothetical protein ACR2LP_05175 [Candidatus Limnocylindrales bacterium]
MTDPLRGRDVSDRSTDESGVIDAPAPDTAGGSSPPATTDAAWATSSSPDPVSADTAYQPVYAPAPQPQAAQPPPYQQPSFQQPSYQQQPYPAYQQPPGAAPVSAWAAGGQEVVATRPHAHSLAVALAAVFLGATGLFWTLIAVGTLLFSSLLPQLGGTNIPQATRDILQSGGIVFAVIMLIIGLPHLLAALGAPLHKGWARWLGVIVSVVGILLGALILAGGNVTNTVNNQTVTFNAVGPALFIAVPYALSLLALIFSRRHFASG